MFALTAAPVLPVRVAGKRSAARRSAVKCSASTQSKTAAVAGAASLCLMVWGWLWCRLLTHQVDPA